MKIIEEEMLEKIQKQYSSDQMFYSKSIPFVLLFSMLTVLVMFNGTEISASLIKP